MKQNTLFHSGTEVGEKLAPLGTSRASWPGILMVAGGLLLILGAPALIWLMRGELANLGPRVIKTFGYGAGGLLLLYFTAGLPLGAILLAAGGARLYPSPVRVRRVLLPLLGIQVAYFIYHAIAVFRYTGVPFLFFALMGCLFVALFLALALVWARKRPKLEPVQQRAADLQLGAGLCFFTAAWQTCGLAGAPGFTAYPEIVLRLTNQPFNVGQLVAIHIFTALGLVFLLLAMRAAQTRSSG